LDFSVGRNGPGNELNGIKSLFPPFLCGSFISLPPSSPLAHFLLSIAFNPEFLMAPLPNLGNDEVYLDLIDGMSSGVIKIAGPFLYVLMPMRLS
ncbi:MAG: hypothetical protein JO331_01355, partial [Verrucomicrobia bacterium]|nr:hypothetical protein [Verrucomicrobiota bacterium]